MLSLVALVCTNSVYSFVKSRAFGTEFMELSLIPTWRNFVSSHRLFVCVVVVKLDS